MGWLSPYPELHTVTAQGIFHYSLLLVMPDLLVAITVSAMHMHVCTAHLLYNFSEKVFGKLLFWIYFEVRVAVHWMHNIVFKHEWEMDQELNLSSICFG